MNQSNDPLSTSAPFAFPFDSTHQFSAGSSALGGPAAETTQPTSAAGSGDGNTARVSGGSSSLAGSQPIGAGSIAAGASMPPLELATWFEKLAEAENQIAGIEVIASILATHFVSPRSAGVPFMGNSTSVRIVVGKKLPKRIFDHRLGWVSRDSDLWRDANRRWEASRFDATWQQPESQETAVRECLIGFNRRGGSSQRLLVWVASTHLQQSSVDSIRQPLDVLARLVTRLPKRTAPAWTLLFGKHPAWTVSLVAMLFALVVCFPVPYPVACTARVEPIGERLVAAPFEATLLQCLVRPGDQVRLDQVLLELDGRPLRLERESLQAELDHAMKEREVALASRRIADSQQAELKQRQLQRQIQLLEDRLNRLQVRSTIDGVVVSGDLERFIGSPLTTGQTLLEIAPLDRLAIEVEIPEFEIGYVTNGAATRVRFAAAGGRSIHANLQSVSPAAEVRDDNNVFVGRIDLEYPDENLRPGMRGDATMYGPRRPLFWRLGRVGWERLLWWIGY